MPWAIPKVLFISGCIYTGEAPLKIIPAVTDLCTFLGIKTLSPGFTVDIIIPWIAPEVPWRAKKLLSAP